MSKFFSRNNAIVSENRHKIAMPRARDEQERGNPRSKRRTGS